MSPTAHVDFDVECMDGMVIRKGVKKKKKKKGKGRRGKIDKICYVLLSLTCLQASLSYCKRRMKMPRSAGGIPQKEVVDRLRYKGLAATCTYILDKVLGGNR